MSNYASVAKYQPCFVVAHDRLPSPLGNICGFSGLLTTASTNIATEQRPVKSTCDSTISSNASKTLPGDTDKFVNNSSSLARSQLSPVASQDRLPSISHSYLLVGLVLPNPKVAYESDPTHLYGGEL